MMGDDDDDEDNDNVIISAIFIIINLVNKTILTHKIKSGHTKIWNVKHT